MIMGGGHGIPVFKLIHKAGYLVVLSINHM